MTKILKISALIAALSLSLATSSCSAPGDDNQIPEKLTFAAFPVDGKVLPGDSYALAVQILEEKLGIPVEFIEVADQVAVAQAAVAGKTDLMVLDGLSYTLASQDEEKFDLLGVMARDPQKEPGSFSYGLTKKTGPQVKTLTDLKGKTVCFTNPTAPAYLFATKALKEVGLSTDPESSEDMKIVFAGGSQEAALALKNDDCNVAFIVDTFIDVLLPKAGIIEQDEFNKFYTSERTPAYAFAASKKLPKDLIEKIRKIVVEDINKTAMVESGLCTSEAECTFLSPNNWGYVATDNSYFNPILEICRDLGYSRCE